MSVSCGLLSKNRNECRNYHREYPHRPDDFHSWFCKNVSLPIVPVIGHKEDRGTSGLYDLPGKQPERKGYLLLTGVRVPAFLPCRGNTNGCLLQVLSVHPEQH